MSERVDPGDIWEGIPKALREAVEVYGTSECTVGNLAVSGPLKPLEEARQVRSEAVKRLAALLREAAADQARLDWLAHPPIFDALGAYDVHDQAVLYFREEGSEIPAYRRAFRETIDLAMEHDAAVDVARGSVPSPTPTKGP